LNILFFDIKVIKAAAVRNGRLSVPIKGMISCSYGCKNCKAG
jgi:hypothetical protein